MPRIPRPRAPKDGDKHVRIEQIAEGVYAALSVPGGAAFSNAGLIDLGGVVVVFDSTLTPHAGAELRAAAVRALGSPPSYLVYSHYHGDHVRGGQSFAAARIVSTGRTRDLVSTRGPEEAAQDAASARQMLEELASDPNVDPLDQRLFSGYYRGILDAATDLTLVPPDLTFVDEIVLHGRRRVAHVVSYGGGHSPSDVLLYLPDVKVAFVGDLVFSGHHPWMGDGNASELLRVLAKVRALPLERIVPGHGPVGPAGEVDRMAEYVRTLGRTVRRVREAGGTPEMVAKLPVPSEYRSYQHRSFYPENLRFMLGQAPIR